MKITYERLNQIIEEEVVKFKKLNEVILDTKVDTSTLDGAKSALQTAISSAKDIAQLKTNVASILGKI